MVTCKSSVPDIKKFFGSIKIKMTTNFQLRAILRIVYAQHSDNVLKINDN